MKIRRLEIRWATNRRTSRPGSATPATGGELLSALAVPDTEAWWLAVNWILDTAEAETIANARRSTMNTNMVLNAVGAGEGIDLVRTKLHEARAEAIRGKREEVDHGLRG